MGHSVADYLRRRTDAELAMQLAEYEKENGEHYEMLLEMIREVQRERQGLGATENEKAQEDV